MYTVKNITINWNSPDILEQLAQTIKGPLETIISVGKNSGEYDKEKLEEILFSSSIEISVIIEDILNKAKAKSLSVTYHHQPEFFGIYESNENVRGMCAGEVNPQKVAKVDQEWLVGLEKEVYGNISQDFLDLGELSYKMAVSERQLHRKIFNLVFLTPNKYIRILRLHRAKQLIDNYVQQSVSQIAYAVGYSDVHYFSKLFAGQYNVAPKELLHSLR
ncbi:helix-turn-helix domain-containing protein [Rudanella paleaurantiibacter]|uniref:Helix-turn-helix domain-containing protein n=1 Tax=Rudanella paleaurantiibacter TaxID=2614655 RepID=A0A7J5TSK3_9BACT|nr:helix-turn-helix transcriptional regulator [Rudanella paleaurantiibacter]KAB7725712.1 helix-turn-helix domain-containing protein [Rudanella paleaurantiibacter]